MLGSIARALRALWRGARWAGRLLAHAAGERPAGDWLERLAAEPGVTPAQVSEFKRLRTLYLLTFCGHCGGSPDYPQGRCPECLKRLAKVLDSGDTSETAITPVDKPAS